MYKNLDIWKYYIKTSNSKALCTLCKNEFSDLGVAQNLKMHLFTKHANDLGIIKRVCGKVNIDLDKTVLCSYFTKSEDKYGVATCKLCEKILSFKTTPSNLKVHLSRCHTNAFIQYLENISFNEDSRDFLKEDINNDNSSDHDDSDKISPEICNYFEQETGGRVRCVVCRASRPNNIEDLKRHLEENHPKLLQISTIAQDNSASDQGSVKGDDSHYTEVIYLEEDTKKTPTKPKFLYKMEDSLKTGKRRQSEVNIKRFNEYAEKKRRAGSSSSDEFHARKHKETNELDTFMTYIKCLLKQLPKDTCAKLQMDIVNLIMNVKLSKNNDSSSTLDISNISLKVPVLPNYVTVTENGITNKVDVETVSNSDETITNSHRYIYTESSTSDQK